MPNKMLVILTTGTEDRGGRATLAFSMGVTSLISGVEAVIYMTMEGTIWSRKEAISNVHVAGFEPLSVYAEQFISAGGRILVCSPCNEFFCAVSDASTMLEGAEISGLTHVVDLALDSSVVTL
jgi:uncharacterized protein